MMIRIFWIALMALVSTQSFAEDKRIYISIGSAALKKAVLAVPSVRAPTTNDRPAARKEFQDVFQSDAELSNIFQLLQEKSFLENAKKAGVTEGTFNFLDWAPLGAEFLVKSTYAEADGKGTFQVFVYDVQRSKQIYAKRYTGGPLQARSLAHLAFDDLVQELTGEFGMARTRIAATCKRGGIKQIVVMDHDGKNQVQVTSDKSIKLFPSWSRDGTYVTYTAIRSYGRLGSRQDLMILDTRTAASSVLFSKQGMNTGAATWHPKENSLLVSITESTNGIRAIYKAPVEGGSLTGSPQRFISSAGFDVEAAYSPDGKYIVFSSLRPGRPMIYTVDGDGKNPVRLTFAGAYNSAPAWAPKGDKILFQGQDKRIGFFDLFLMSPTGTNLERLTKNEGSNENATFSPDGRHIVFASSQSGRYQLYRMNTDGTGRRQITSGAEECYNPAWSPRFP